MYMYFFGVYTYQHPSAQLCRQLVDQLGHQWMFPLFLEKDGVLRAYVSYVDGGVDRYREGFVGGARWRRYTEVLDENYRWFVTQGVRRHQPGEFSALYRGELAIRRPSLQVPYEKLEASAVDVHIVKDAVFDTGEVPPDFQRELVRKASETFASTSAATGYIAFTPSEGISITASPWEDQHDIRGNINHLRDYCRGAYWGNFFSPEHVAKIGGPDALRKGDFAVVKEVDGGWYVQTSEDVTRRDDPAIQRLEQILEPILPKPVPRPTLSAAEIERIINHQQQLKKRKKTP